MVLKTCSAADDNGLPLTGLISFALHFGSTLEVFQRNSAFGERWHEGARQLFLGDILSLKIWLWPSNLLPPSCVDQIAVIPLFSLSTHRALRWSLNLLPPGSPAGVEESAHPSREVVTPLVWLFPVFSPRYRGEKGTQWLLAVVLSC